MKIVGEIETRRYRLTVMVDSPPPSFQGEESQWLYITKHNADGSIGRQSIGVGMSNIAALLQVLSRAESEYPGERKEFRVKSAEFEQRTKSCE